MSSERRVVVEVRDGKNFRRFSLPLVDYGLGEHTTLDKVIESLQQIGGVYYERTFYPWHTIQSIVETNF